MDHGSKESRWVAQAANQRPYCAVKGEYPEISVSGFASPLKAGVQIGKAPNVEVYEFIDAVEQHGDVFILLVDSLVRSDQIDRLTKFRLPEASVEIFQRGRLSRSPLADESDKTGTRFPDELIERTLQRRRDPNIPMHIRGECLGQRRPKADKVRNRSAVGAAQLLPKQVGEPTPDSGKASANGFRPSSESTAHHDNGSNEQSRRSHAP